MKLLCAFLIVAGHIAAAAEDADLALHADRAKAAQQQGDFRKAAAEWETIAKLSPGIPEVYSNLGMMRHFAKEYPKAIVAFRQALQLNPKLTGPHLFLGIDYYLTASPEKALPELKETLTLEPGNAIARKWLALTYFESGDFFAAARELTVAAAQTPGDPELLFWLSRSHLKLLFNSYARIRQLAPKSALLASLRDQSSIATEDVNPEALPQLESELKNHAADPELWFQLGSLSKNLALKELNAFLERSPQSYRVSQLQAEFALAQGDDDRAIEQYRKGLAINPSAVQLHLGIGNIHMSRHQYAEAIPEYEAELQADPYALTALERTAEASAELNDTAHAETYLKRALAIDPHAFDARRLMGKVSFERGDFKAAVANYLDAVSHTSKPPAPLLFQLSKAYRKLGNNGEADRWLALFQHQLASEHQDTQQRFKDAQLRD